MCMPRPIGIWPCYLSDGESEGKGVAVGVAKEQGEQTGHREGEERGEQVEAVHRRQQHQQPVSQQ